MTMKPYIGTAGWNIPAMQRSDFPLGGSLLERYARTLPAVEINTSFYRPHRRSTYVRWALSVPDTFRFSVKIPKTISHERGLRDCEDLLADLIGSTEGLGDRHGAWLLQLPPKQYFEESVFTQFVACLQARSNVDLVVEPRHVSWFTTEAETCLVDNRAARVAADPALAMSGGRPGGWTGLRYFRWHGSPRMYHSNYDNAALEQLRGRIAQARCNSVRTWCIFDNTASGAATGNALSSLRHFDS